jgi:hypothetical protein
VLSTISGVVLVTSKVLDCVEVPLLILSTVFSAKSFQSSVAHAIRTSSKVKLRCQPKDTLTHVHQAFLTSGYGVQAASDVLITITLSSGKMGNTK